jgi:branched-chain amino acid aminotransferase
MADRDGWIWYDGKLVEWRSATTHVLTHSLHYGLAVFEGVRAYKTEIGTAIFRLKEHTDRLFNSAKIYMMEIPYSKDELIAAQKEVVRANKLESCYLRPLAFYGSEKMGVSPVGCGVHVSIAAWPWGEGHSREDLFVRPPPRERDHGAREGRDHVRQLDPREPRSDATRL